MNYVWVSFISKFDQKEEERITLQSEGEKEVSMSAECQNVEHDDYYYRRRTNFSDDRRTILMCNAVDSMRIAG